MEFDKLSNRAIGCAIEVHLTSHAAAGEILVNEATAAAIAEGLTVERLEPLKVKGKDLLIVPSRMRA